MTERNEEELKELSRELEEDEGAEREQEEEGQYKEQRERAKEVVSGMSCGSLVNIELV